MYMDVKGTVGLTTRQNRAIEANKIKPVVHDKVFTLDETKE